MVSLLLYYVAAENDGSCQIGTSVTFAVSYGYK